jgi:hypothetical protein
MAAPERFASLREDDALKHPGTMITLARLLPALVLHDKSSNSQDIFTLHPGCPRAPQLG